MNDQHVLEPVLSETLSYLRHLVDNGIEPSAALAGLSAVGERHPQTPLDLVWLEEPFDRSVQYDVLIHLQGEGTVSLSFSPEDGPPWPLRGVQRWRDQDLARVNGVVLTVERAVAHLDFVWDQAPIVRRLVDVCLIEEMLQRDPVALDAADLQEAMDAFRRAHRLYTAEDAHRWLADRGLAPEKLEQLLEDQATLTRLRARIAADGVEEYFVAHRKELDEVALLRLDFADQDRACAGIEEVWRGTAFLTVAQRSIADAFARGEAAPVLESTVLRRRDSELEPPRTLESGDVLGPLPSQRGAALLQILTVRPACLDEATRRTIVQLLFEDWLAERRRRRASSGTGALPNRSIACEAVQRLVSANGTSPFRAEAIDRYARAPQAAVSVRRPGAARLAVLWLLLLLALGAGGAWLTLAWRYLAG